MKYSKILLCFGALWASSAFPAPAPCDTLRVAFLTDIHVTPGNVQDSLFRVAVDEINASPCDIVIFGGDLTNLGSDAELEYVHGLISRLEKPWHAVPGNHETTWSESACTTRIFGHDGRTAFRAGDYLFLGYASGPFMKMAMGAVRTEDLAWLAVEAAKARPGQRIVSLCHYPLNNDLTNRTEVTATLRRLGIPLTEADADAIEPLRDSVDGQTFSYRGAVYDLPLLGRHQLRNAAVALETVAALRTRGWRIPDAAVHAGLAQVRWPARFEVLRRAPWFVLDGGHNPQCAQTVADNLARYFPGRRITLLVGVLADKDYPDLIAQLDPYAAAYIAATPLSPRALPAEELGAYLQRFGKPVTVCPDPAQAAARALAQAGEDDVICAVGSLYMAGAIRTYLRREHDENSGH